MAFFAVGAFFFWLIVRNQNLNEIKSKLLQAQWVWALVALIFGFISNVFRALRWNMLIEPLGQKVRLINSLGAVMVGYMANLAIPRLGEVMRCAVLQRYEKVPINKLLGTVVAERAIDVVTILVLLIVVMIAEFELMSTFSKQQILIPLQDQWLHRLPMHPWLLVGTGVVLLLGLWLVRFLLIKWKNKRATLRLLQLVKGFVAGLRSVMLVRQQRLFVLYSLLIWTMYTLMSYVCFFCFEATSELSFIAALAIMVFGGFGWAAPVQGGFGTFHLIVAQALVLFGIAENDGLAYAILSHATQVAGMLLLGLVALFALPLINSRRSIAMTN